MTCGSFFATTVGGTTGAAATTGDIVEEEEVVVVHELPLLIFKIIRGESQPESVVFEFVVTSSG